MPTLTTEEAFTKALQFHQAGRLGDAEALYRQVLVARPNHAQALHHLGIISYQVGRHDLAVRLIRRALDLNPGNSAAYINLGLAQAIGGRLDDAVAAYRRALELKPDCAEAYNNMGNALAVGGRRNEAVAAFRQAALLNPRYAEAYYNLGTSLAEEDQFEEAAEAYRRAVNLTPEFAEAWHNLGAALFRQERFDEAMDVFRRAVNLKPDDAGYLSNLISKMRYFPACDDDTVRREQLLWNSRYLDPLRSSWLPHRNDPDPERRLRIGYVSPSFYDNAVAYFLVPLLESHDHAYYEIYCYSSLYQPDAVTERLRKSADVWRDVGALSDAELAVQVRADDIDILVDLTMHTTGNRLLTFARKPAPLQVSWLAYPGSTGMEAIDYRLTDAQIDPPAEQRNTLGGQPVCLPDAWCCYEPIAEFPPVSALPAGQKKIVTFGSLNRFDKIHEAVLHCWAELLAAVPASRLLMICSGNQTRRRVLALFEDRGIAKDRIELVAFGPWPAFCALFERIDIALDPFPCNGMTTTCHTLWMGVPVITWTGTNAVSRASSSLLHTAGLPEWVAHSKSEYIAIASQWASDLPRLAELRANLRALMQASPLMDAARFTRNIEAAYRGMWRRWCAEPHSLAP